MPAFGFSEGTTLTCLESGKLPLLLSPLERNHDIQFGFSDTTERIPPQHGLKNPN